MSCERTKILKKELKKLGLTKYEVFMIINHTSNNITFDNEAQVINNFNKIRHLLIQNNICEPILNTKFNFPQMDLDYSFSKTENDIKKYYD